MNVSRWRGAETPLRIRFIAAAALGSLIVAGAAFMVRAWLQADPIYPWKAAALFAAMMTAALPLVGEHPFARLGPANRVTIIRVMLVAFTAGLIGEPVTSRVAATAAMVAAIAAALDGVDGWLARRTRMASAFGARADMETDALLIMVLSVLVWLHDRAGAWVLVCGLMRYAFVAAGWLLPWMAGPLEPTLRGKTVAVAQVIGLGVALAPIASSGVSRLIAAATLGALVWSFAVDVGRLWRQATRKA